MRLALDAETNFGPSGSVTWSKGRHVFKLAVNSTAGGPTADGRTLTVAPLTLAASLPGTRPTAPVLGKASPTSSLVSRKPGPFLIHRIPGGGTGAANFLPRIHSKLLTI